MKTYIDRNFKREYLKGVDLQQDCKRIKWIEKSCGK